MAEIRINNEILATVKDKVVVLTGGGNGIGAATVTNLFHAGAHVYYCDWDEKHGTELDRSLRSGVQSGSGSSTFMKANVTDYEAQLALFDAAFDKHGRIDMAIYCAGITDPRGWLDVKELDLKSVRKVPQQLINVLDVNLIGCLYFSRIALAYLKEDAAITPESSKSLTFISSVAGFKETPGVIAYSASKHGIIGLMRSLRMTSVSEFNVRVNAICPWATDTQIFKGLSDSWRNNNLPFNTPADVARLIQHVAADPELHGKAVFVAGGKGFDIEEGINRLEPEWLGEQQARELNRGQLTLGKGTGWLNNE
uniref:Short-chain dehydrogenase/reductase SDR n=1 Tax=Coccidioides posadasii RMSCC 3488 TaxID=454284 RepID=A0A0J6FJR7_COCPO|nr:short-chain dehydrogenase/reductase SDR [Coccidioides posadasii RMSCC 3488]